MDTSEHGIKGDTRKQAFTDLPVEQKKALIKQLLGDFTEGLGSDPVGNQRTMEERMGLIPPKEPEKKIVIPPEGFVSGYKCEGVIAVEFHDDSTHIKLVPGNKYTILIPGAKPLEIDVGKESLWTERM